MFPEQHSSRSTDSTAMNQSEGWRERLAEEKRSRMAGLQERERARMVRKVFLGTTGPQEGSNVIVDPG